MNKPQRKMQCLQCKHRDGWRRCKAFPYGYPKKYDLGWAKHDELDINQKGDWIYEPQKVLQRFSEENLTHPSIYKVHLKELVCDYIKSQGYESEDWITVQVDVEITVSEELHWHKFQMIHKTKEVINIDKANVDILFTKYLESILGVMQAVTGSNRLRYSLNENGEEKKEYSSTSSTDSTSEK